MSLCLAFALASPASPSSGTAADDDDEGAARGVDRRRRKSSFVRRAALKDCEIGAAGALLEKLKKALIMR